MFGCAIFEQQERIDYQNKIAFVATRQLFAPWL
jgi:hypothetical protein